MIVGNKAITQLYEPEGSFVMNMSKFPGGLNSCLDRIPAESSGVYSWFRAFNYPEDVDSLYCRLIEDLEKSKFIERKGHIKPYYEVSLRSRSWISDGKRKRIKKALQDEGFKNHLLSTLNASLLFQTPLYIGKAIDLRKRIKTHLAEDSPLRLRFDEAAIDMKQTLLLIVPNFDESVTAHEEAQEDLYEEIYSRLFSPQFSIRLG